MLIERTLPRRAFALSLCLAGLGLAFAGNAGGGEEAADEKTEEAAPETLPETLPEISGQAEPRQPVIAQDPKTGEIVIGWPDDLEELGQGEELPPGIWISTEELDRLLERPGPPISPRFRPFCPAEGEQGEGPCAIARRISHMQPCLDADACPAADAWHRSFGLPGIRHARPRFEQPKTPPGERP